MRWVIPFLLASAAAYLAIDNLRLRRELDATQAAAGARGRAAGWPAAPGRAAAGARPATAGGAERAIGWIAGALAARAGAEDGDEVVPLTIEIAPRPGESAAGRDRRVAGEVAAAIGRETARAEEAFAAFAAAARLAPEQTAAARTAARDLADMLAGRIVAAEREGRIGPALADAAALARDAEARLLDLLSPEQRVAYAHGGFDFPRDAVWLDDREPPAWRRWLDRRAAGTVQPGP